MLDKGLLPEVVPTRETQGLRSAHAMLEAGRALLEKHSLEELSIESVCEHADSTIGAFYGRFGSKDAFFLTMQRVLLIQVHALVYAFKKEHASGRSGVDDLAADMIALLVAVLRANPGAIRAAPHRTRGVGGLHAFRRAAPDRVRGGYHSEAARPRRPPASAVRLPKPDRRTGACNPDPSRAAALGKQ